MRSRKSLVKQLDSMAEFQHYGTLKVAIELRSVPVVIFAQSCFPRRSSEGFRDFLDLTRPTSQEKKS